MNRRPMRVGDTYTDRYGRWIVTFVARDGSGFESERIRKRRHFVTHRHG